MSQFFGLMVGATGLTFMFGTFPVWGLVIGWIAFFVVLAGKAFGGSDDS